MFVLLSLDITVSVLNIPLTREYCSAFDALEFIFIAGYNKFKI